MRGIIVIYVNIIMHTVTVASQSLHLGIGDGMCEGAITDLLP